jgi:hypothetical protein
MATFRTGTSKIFFGLELRLAPTEADLGAEKNASLWPQILAVRGKNNIPLCKKDFLWALEKLPQCVPCYFPKHPTCRPPHFICMDNLFLVAIHVLSDQLTPHTAELHDVFSYSMIQLDTSANLMPKTIGDASTSEPPAKRPRLVSNDETLQISQRVDKLFDIVQSESQQKSEKIQQQQQMLQYQQHRIEQLEKSHQQLLKKLDDICKVLLLRISLFVY